MIPVMIVEDEFLVRLGIKSVIEWGKYGFEIVTEAQNGKEGIDNFIKYNPQVILTDLSMPVMGGLEMMKIIREMNEDVKFIVVSAYNDFEFVQESIKIGVEYYTIKGTLIQDEIIEVLQKISKRMLLNNINISKPFRTNEIAYSKLIDTDSNDIISFINNNFNSSDNLYILNIKSVFNKSFDYLVISGFDKQKINYTKITDIVDSICFIIQVNDNLAQVIMQLKEEISKYVSNELIFGISSMILDFKNINKYYIESLSNIDSSFNLENNSYVDNAKLYVKNNLDINMKIKDVAKFLNLSANYLGKLFYSETGIYLTDYIINLKLEYARELLLVKGKNISEITFLIGIYDQHYFSKLFKKKYKLSPSQYSKKYTNS